METRNRLMRQADLINTEAVKNQEIVIIGCGGIGSHLAIALARMGAENLRIYDADTVDIENVNSQGFDMADVGKHKVDAIKQKIIRATGTIVKTHKEYVNESTKLNLKGNAYVILALDSMEARKIVANLVYRDNDYWSGCNADLLINPSMGAEYMNIDTYECQNDWLAKFEQAWFTDDEGVQESCTAKATIYTTQLISGFVSKIIKDKLMNKNYTKQITFDISKNQIVSMFSTDGTNLLL